MKKGNMRVIVPAPVGTIIDTKTLLCIHLSVRYNPEKGNGKSIKLKIRILN
jgi:hypothetical protein